MKMINKIYKAIKNPTRVFEVLRVKTLSIFGRDEFVGAIGNRSVSDTGAYVASVHKSLKNYKNFSKFKRDIRYQAILEHCSQQQGAAYLDLINQQSPEFIEKIDLFKQNDLIGGATLHYYNGVGLISPSTLRYIKVASDIKNIFGESIGDRIAEIGVGYGGQLLIADKVLQFKSYDLFDLPPVLALASKYIESHTLESAYSIKTLNQIIGDISYDLVISNYAFSELPSALQLKYIKKILANSKRGYLTMNSGRENSAFKEDKLSLVELNKYLPAFEVIEENPLTSPGNYNIVWGR